MAKTYIDTVKYEITINFRIAGLVDKHDIVGAVFGQSEGLIGEDLDLRELQNNGKIGRIEITQKTIGGNTQGDLIIPSSMDMVDTCLLAAAIETVDKVGPYKSEFKTVQIEDTRTKKRKYLKERATELLRKLLQEQIPDSAEIARQVREEVRISDIKAYGPDKVPAGPAVDESDSIIIVEGRADVLNLLKNNIKNVVGLEGGNISPTIIELAKKKTVTVFVDGDRGGELILRKICELADVDYVARAPAGKEVEELVRKEIIMSLRKKVPVGEISPEKVDHSLQNLGTPIQARVQTRQPFKKPIMERPQFMARKPLLQRTTMPVSTVSERKGVTTKTAVLTEKPIEKEKTKLSPEEKKFREIMKTLKGTLKAKLLDDKGNELATVNVRDLMKRIEKEKNIHTIVFDGIITKRLVDACDTKGISYLVGIKAGKIHEGQKTKIIVIE